MLHIFKVSMTLSLCHLPLFTCYTSLSPYFVQLIPPPVSIFTNILLTLLPFFSIYQISSTHSVFINHLSLSMAQIPFCLANTWCYAVLQHKNYTHSFPMKPWVDSCQIPQCTVSSAVAVTERPSEQVTVREKVSERQRGIRQTATQRYRMRRNRYLCDS